MPIVEAMSHQSAAVGTVYPPGYREDLRRHAGSPETERICLALGAVGGRISGSPRDLRRRLDAVFLGILGQKARGGVLRHMAGFSRVAKASDVAYARLFPTMVGADVVTLETDADCLPQVVRQAIDDGLSAVGSVATRTLRP